MKKWIGMYAVLAGQSALAQEPELLDPIVVELLSGQQVIGNLPEEYVGGQVAKGSRVGLLGNLDIMDTPFSTTSYTSKTIEDRSARTVADALVNDPSVTSTHSSGGNLDSFSIRGFPTNEGNFGEVAFNGVFGVAPTFRLYTDYAERIEVLKGPSALLYGISPNSSVGGVVNIVPKRAGEIDLTRVTIDYTSALQGGTHIDVSRRFGEDKQFGIRVNGSYRGGDAPIDDQTREVLVGSAALDFKGENLRATLDVIGQTEDLDAPQRPIFPAGSVAIPHAPDGHLNIQAPWEWSELEDLSALGRIEYDLTKQVTLFGAVGGGNSYVERVFGAPRLLNEAGDVSVLPQYGVFDVDRITTEAGLRAHFDTGTVAHSLSFQASYLEQSLGRGLASGVTQFTNIFDPVYRPYQDIPSPDSVPPVSESEFHGLALADILSIFDERVQLVLGGRWQHIDASNFSATTGAVTSSSDENALTPSVGLVIKPWENVSLYANYVEGLSIGQAAPATAVNAGETLPPYRSIQMEVGAKIDFGTLGVTVSAFQIERPFGQLESHGSDFVFVEGGEQRNRGLEFSVFGEVMSGLRVIGGAMLLDGKLTKTNSPETLGNKAIGVPSVQLSLGTEWDTTFLQGLTLTANVIHNGRQYVDTANTQDIPSWTRLDLGARYVTEIYDRPVTFRTSVENVFDTDYWAGVASYGGLAQGAPLTVKMSMTTDF